MIHKMKFHSKNLCIYIIPEAFIEHKMQIPKEYFQFLGW